MELGDQRCDREDEPGRTPRQDELAELTTRLAILKDKFGVP